MDKEEVLFAVLRAGGARGLNHLGEEDGLDMSFVVKDVDMSQGGAQGLWYLRGPQTGHQQCLLLFIQTREVSHLQNLVSQKLFYKINILTQYVIKIQ
jgi:hypothetical protein